MVEFDHTTAQMPDRAKSRRALFSLAMVMSLFAASGANCGQWVRSYSQPRTLPEAATLDQIVNTVNGNTAKVQSMQSTQATLKVPGAHGFAG